MPLAFWSESLDTLLERLQSSAEGLSGDEAARRNDLLSATRLKPRTDLQPLRFFLGQLRNPIMLILLSAAGISFFLSDRTDAVIILTIIFVSALLGFWQEYGAPDACKADPQIYGCKTRPLSKEKSSREP